MWCIVYIIVYIYVEYIHLYINMYILYICVYAHKSTDTTEYSVKCLRISCALGFWGHQQHPAHLYTSIMCLVLWWALVLGVKNPPANAGAVGLIPGSGRSPGEGNGTTPVFLPGESHGQRSLAGCSPRGRTESDMTEATWQCTAPQS